ncbi:hypothetical protein RUM44_009786 [Polyplax serrata]|uniref:Uncharacterized protein n=1 Tax=Polyplax serrata TaxID=468196 RepID=A0ABR1ATN9_POLSC
MDFYVLDSDPGVSVGGEEWKESVAVAAAAAAAAVAARVAAAEPAAPAPATSKKLIRQLVGVKELHN